MPLGYDEILKRVAESRRERIVAGVRLLEPTIEGRLAFEEVWRANSADEALRVVETIATCAVDDDGRALFDTDERKAALRNEAGGAFARELFDACFELLSVTRGEVDAAMGESAGDPTDERSTSSPLSSESPIPALS